MNKKIILGIVILILLSSFSYAIYVFSSTPTNQADKSDNLTNNTTNKTNINDTIPKNEIKTNKESSEKYYCNQCDQYHPQPPSVYHRYGNCPICGKYVDTQSVSHTHDTGPDYKEEPKYD